MQLSSGTFIHIDALGPQDEFLSALPGTGQTKPPSHFRQCIRRHSRFALDVKEEEFPNGFFFGTNNRMDLGRRGDMLGDITLEIRLPIVDGASPSDTWIDGIGHVILRRLNLIVDDTLVQTQERLWYDLSDKIFLSAAHTNGKNEMIGKGHVLSLTKSHILYLPLKLLSCKSHHKNQVFLPLLSVPGSTISLTFECESFENCVTSYSGNEPLRTLDVRALIEYVFLDSAEKERILRRPTTIMFEDVQDMESRSYVESNSTDGAFRIPLDRVDVDLSELNVPVKALIWVSYLTNYVNSAQHAMEPVEARTYNITVVNDGFGNVFVVDGVNRPTLHVVRGSVITFVQSDVSNINHPIAFKNGSNGNSYTTGVVSTGTPGSAGSQTMFTVASNAPIDLRYYCTVHGDGMGNTISVTGSYSSGPASSGPANVKFFNYTDDIASATLLLSGRERIEPRNSEYFKRIDPYMHNFKMPGSNVHIYSLCLDVGGMQPSGHLSFDQVHAPLLRVFLKEKRSDLTVKVFAMCYKMLVVDRGRLSMKFV